MLRLETEIEELRAANLLDEAATQRALALDRAQVLSLYEEFRLALYAAVGLLTAGLGLLLKRNYQRLGPVTLLAAVLAASGVCYATALRRRAQGRPRSIVGDYLLLLGALLLSAAVGYGESQFHWFGAAWARQLLLLAIVHGAAAYYFDSRLVLSVALATFAAWFGVEPRFGSLLVYDAQAPRMGWRALECALLILGWRAGERWLRGTCRYAEIYDHYALNLAFLAALSWCWVDGARLGAVALLAVLGVLAVSLGLRRGSELMLAYGVGYPAIGLTIALVGAAQDPLGASIAVLAIMTGAAMLLWRLRTRLKEAA